MATPNEFWLTLHQLADSYRAEGANPSECLANVAREFQVLPLEARRQVLVDLAFVAKQMPDVYKVISTLAMQGENEEKTKRSGK
jgi:hypothetical protein